MQSEQSHTASSAGEGSPGEFSAADKIGRVISHIHLLSFGPHFTPFDLAGKLAHLWNRSRSRSRARPLDFEDEYEHEHAVPGYQGSVSLVRRYETGILFSFDLTALVAMINGQLRLSWVLEARRSTIDAKVASIVATQTGTRQSIN